MDTVNWLLMNIAAAVLWLWEMLEDIFGAVASALDAVLNPHLSPLLSVVNPICTVIGDAVYAALSPLPVWLGLTLISTVAGVVMLVAFGYLSNQEAIGNAKDDIKANLLALKLYKDELHVTFSAQCRLVWAIVRLQRYMLVPILILMPPMLVGLAQMGIRYQWRPLQSGEQTLIKLQLEKDRANPEEAMLQPNSGIVVEVGPIPAGRELAWRVRGAKPGRHVLKFTIEGAVVEKELVVGDAFERVSAEHPDGRWTRQLLHPVERPLPADSPVQLIEVLYPSRESWFHGANWWILSFFVVSMAAALVFKPVFKVKF